MSNSRKSTFFFSLRAALLCGFAASPLLCAAQEEAKSIQAEVLMKNRPVVKIAERRNNDGTGANKPVKVGAPKKKFYRVAKSFKARRTSNPTTQVAPRQTEEALLGLTVWKIRPATKNDAAKELIEREAGGQNQNSEYTLERLGADTALANGEWIRLSIESLSHSGFLYLVDRELYNDGTYSPPKLIYPTLKTRSRFNPVSAGNLVFVPEAPRYFSIEPQQNKKKQTAEALTIIVSPTMLIEPAMLQDKALDLPIEQFTEWLKNWEVDTTLLEQIDGAGQAITPVEQTAGQDAAKGLVEQSVSLRQNDPSPQSIFRSRINRGNPVLINVLLEFRGQ